MRPRVFMLAAFALACARPPGDPRPPPSSATPTPIRKPEPTPDGVFDAYVVDWSAADRGELERRIAGRWTILVHVEGRRATLEPDCHGETSPNGTAWTYLPRGPHDEHVFVDGVAIDVTVVGRWLPTFFARRAADLRGACDRVTHVVASLEVGAVTGMAGEVSGAANVTTAANDGDRAACTAADPSPRTPPVGCSAVVRLSLRPIVPAYQR